jgi:hypothetical protein
MLASPARAQSVRAPTAYDLELGAGYSHLRDSGVSTKFGVAADFAVKILAAGAFRAQVVFGASFDHFGAYSDDEYDYEPDTYKTYTAGVRVGSVGSSKVRPFAQILFGVQKCCDASGTSSGSVIEPGGGLNFAVSSIDVRVAVGFPIASYDGERFKQVHLTIGIAVPLGKR